MKWLKTRIQKRYALDVLRELLSASILQAIDAERESREHEAALRKWAHARDAEWSEMSTEDQERKPQAYAMKDKMLYDYVSTLENEVKS